MRLSALYLEGLMSRLAYPSRHMSQRPSTSFIQPPEEAHYHTAYQQSSFLEFVRIACRTPLVNKDLYQAVIMQQWTAKEFNPRG